MPEARLRRAFVPRGLFLPVAALACVLAGGMLAACTGDADTLAPASPSTPFRQLGDATPLETTSGARDFSLPPVALPPATASTALVDPSHVYDLAELIDIAQTANPQTRVAWEQARQAAIAVGIVKALYLPVVTATVVGGYQRFSNSGQIAALPSSNTSGDVHGSVSSVALQWLLFDFGERDALTRAATARAFASDIAFTGQHQKIIYDVSRAFFEYTAARQKVAIARQSKAESRRIQDAARARFVSGVGTTVETAQADQQAAQAAFDLIQAEGSERDAYHSLLAGTGLDAAARIAVRDVSGRPLAPDAMAPVEHYLQEAIARRPDVQAGLAVARAAHEGIAAAKAEFLPKVFMSASGTYLSGGLNVTSLPTLGSLTQGSSSGAVGTTTNQSNATVLGGVSIPIYDGGVRSSRLAEALSRSGAAEADVERLAQSAAFEIVSADDALRTSLAAYQAAGALVKASGTAEDATFAAYKSGAGSLTAAIDAEKALLSARLARAQAHGVALIAASSLAFLTGRLTSSDALAARRQSLIEGPLGQSGSR